MPGLRRAAGNCFSLLSLNKHRKLHFILFPGGIKFNGWFSFWEQPVAFGQHTVLFQATYPFVLELGSPLSSSKGLDLLLRRRVRRKGGRKEGRPKEEGRKYQVLLHGNTVDDFEEFLTAAVQRNFDGELIRPRRHMLPAWRKGGGDNSRTLQGVRRKCCT